jgi:hypothetical protein
VIDFKGLQGGMTWSARWNSTTAANFVLPPTPKRDGTNPAGGQFRFTENGQLVLLGLTGRVVTGGTNAGAVIKQRVGASTDTDLIRYVYAAAGTYHFSDNELWVPLVGAVYSSPAGPAPVTAGRLYVDVVGTITALEITAWGVWLESKDHHPLTAAPYQIRS